MYKIGSTSYQPNRCAYSIQKLIHATFSQGHRKFGRTTGFHFTCISLLNACFSIFKAVPRWNRLDIEYVIEKSDALYKLQNADELLLCTCFPRVVKVEHLQVSVDFLKESYGLWSDSHEQNIINLTRQILNSLNCTGLLFLTQGVFISII